MKILAIETSCDETAVALIDATGDFNTDFSFQVLGNALLSQASLHEQYGGVFPNVAKREHQRNLIPILMETLRQAGSLKERRDRNVLFPETKLGKILEREPELFSQLIDFLRAYETPPIDAIAVTVGPGLEPALWVGINFAKTLSHAWNIAIVPVNHMEGHIMMSMLGNQQIKLATSYKLEARSYPMLSLLISGGHTELILSPEWMKYTYIGRTRDDAVGEAFDKVARLLGLPYPGGPHISALAEMSRMHATNTQIDADQRSSAVNRRPSALVLPRPMIDSPNYDFSFAGLKTAVRRIVEANQPLTEQFKMEIALEFENAVADVLVAKTMRAIEEYGAQTVLIGGGVSANTHIRAQLSSSIKDYGLSTKLLVPPPELATDNALMIALAGHFRAQKNEFADPDSLRANGNLKLA